jgi:hypothetical protein
MSGGNRVDVGKRAKNIAAILYLLVLAFVVGGSYINQRGQSSEQDGQAAYSELTQQE